MILPAYKINAHFTRKRDLQSMLQCQNLTELRKNIYHCSVDEMLDKNIIKQYLENDSFKNDAEYFESESLINGLVSVIIKLTEVALNFGFPGRPTQKIQESKIDIALSKALIEVLEENKFNVLPCHANSAYVQEFMTQRIFPLLTFWRWQVVTGKSISVDRIISSTRNYFYTLWIMGWLFDKGIEAQSCRWDLLDQMSSDSLVQIIERTGIGFRKGFAQAIALERKSRSLNISNSALDNLVRGCMKRATFTFSTTTMIDDEKYYKSICNYLFNWAEKNYLVKDNI